MQVYLKLSEETRDSLRVRGNIKYALLANKIKYVAMNKLKLIDTDVIKILNKSLPDLDTIRLEAKKDYLKIFGVDTASVLFLELIINKNAFDRYEIASEKGISISLEEFKRILEIALSGSLTEFQSLSISFMNTYIDVRIEGRYSKFHEKLPHIPTGISEPPPYLPNFNNAPLCESRDAIKDFRLVSTRYNPSRGSAIVLIEISDVKKCIEFKPSDPVIQSSSSINGDTRGSGKTATSSYVLDNVSKVADLDAIKKLTICLINEGNIKFSYSFNNGELSYIAAKAAI